MLTEFITLSSIFIAILGIGIIIFLISRINYEKNLQEINFLIERYDINKFHPKKLPKIHVFFKRIFDIIIAIICIFSLIPLFILISIVIKLTSKGPIFYKQKRIGEGGKIFYTYKYRTMVIEEELTSKNVWKSRFDARITKFGRFLRYTYLDELPKLWNVLKGTMTFVGTSIWTEFMYDDIPIDLIKIIMSYKPGLTSLWAVSKDRQDFNYKRRLYYDLFYLSNMSFLFDLSILIRTINISMAITAST